jgi:hypothetical protein
MAGIFAPRCCPWPEAPCSRRVFTPVQAKTLVGESVVIPGEGRTKSLITVLADAQSRVAWQGRGPTTEAKALESMIVRRSTQARERLAELRAGGMSR